MFNVGGMELLVIALVALVVLGPEKLPGAIRQFGQVVGELRRISAGFQSDLRGAMAEAERDAEAARRADAAGPPNDSHDPGAARAVAEAELAAIEGAQARDDHAERQPSASTESSGSEGSDVTVDPSNNASSGGDSPASSAS